MKRCAIVVNPTKFPASDPRRRDVEAVLRGYGWARPLWLETTIDDPGRGQALQAMDAGVDFVAALGGDGTTRFVADALIGTDMPLAILAAGTGNLFARNVKLPPGRPADAMRTALRSVATKLDTNLVQFDRDGSGTWDEDQTSIVMAGCGLDATIMAGTSEKLKKRASWLSYPLVGLKHAAAEPHRMSVRVDDEKLPEPQPVTSVLVGNCGELTGGIRLMPDATFLDGILHVAVVNVKGANWAKLISHVLSGQKRTSEHLTVRDGKAVEVHSAVPVEAEIDGDVVGEVHGMKVTVRPRSLTVLLPLTD